MHRTIKNPVLEGGQRRVEAKNEDEFSIVKELLAVVFQFVNRLSVCLSDIRHPSDIRIDFFNRIG